uniref:Dynein light intermediate chain n=1 Tax=Trichobilharzia regenti TaxID=157069 RepID=A0AA85JFF8_TRIRE|nr:unnamed protein product [Trichobilharzia regenti]
MREMEKDGELQGVKCLWSTLLHEVTDKASAGLSSSKNLVVLGDEKCGKSTLISRLQGSEDMKEGFGLEYLLIDIKDEARDAITNLSVCIMDGNPVQSYLLKYAITEDTFDDQMAVIVVSIREPWKMIETLEKWADILAKHIDKLKLSEDKLKTCKSKILKEFYNYLEPEALANAATNPVKLASFSFSSMSETSFETSPESPPAHYANTYPEEIHEHNVMNNNLGVPLIVVVTKTDLMKTMVNEKEYTEEHFDFIQMHVRRFCLTYGAALFYVSVKEDLNCDLLKSYIQHRLYGLPFNHSPYVVEGNCIFVPAGWDNHKKINILGENLTTINPESPYSAVIPRPIPRKTNNREPEIVPVDEQAFLLRLSMIKDQENIEPGMLKDLLGPSGPDSSLRQSGNTSKNVPVIKPADDGNRLPNSPTNMFRPKVPQGNSSLNLPNSGTSDGVLADFFSKLLKKRPTAGGTVGDAPTSSASELQLSKAEEEKVQKETREETVDETNNNTPKNNVEDDTIKQTQENLTNEQIIEKEKKENQQEPQHEKNQNYEENKEELNTNTNQENSDETNSVRENQTTQRQLERNASKYEEKPGENPDKDVTERALKSQTDDIQLTRSPDAPIIASSVKSSLGSTPDINVESMATDEISSLISEKAENSPTQSDSIADTKIEDISNNNTTDSGLQSQMDDFQLTRSPDAPIIASSVKSSLGSTPDINVESMATDEISSLISEKAENSPTQSDSIADTKIEDISNNNTTDSGLQSQMDDIQLTRSPDAPIIASSVKSSLGSTPDINVESMATDEISSLISEKAENSPTQSDSIADTKIEDISNNNTTDSGLQSQMDDFQLTRSPDAPIIASSVKSSLGSTPDTNVESMATDEISSLISEKAENSPTQSDSIADTKIEDISNNNTTDSGLQSQMDDIQLTRSPDAPIIASSVKSSLGSTPDINVESMATDEISSLISEKAENSPTQSDSIADTKIEDISNNNTTDSGLQSQMDDFQLTRSPDAPIIASSVKSSLGSTPDINVESMATDEISSLISEKAENSPTQSDSIADTKIEDISNNNTTDSGLQSQMDDFQLTRSPDAPIIASSVKSSLGSTPDINVESMATDEISSLISEKAENSPTQSDSIADTKIEDISNNNTTDSGLQSQMDDIQLTRSPDAPIIASSVKSSLGSTPDTNVESMATDEISSLISEKAENSPTQSDSIADTKIEDISNNNTTDSGLQSQMDDIQLTRSPDAPIIASSVKSSLGSTPDINVESMATDEISSLISEKAENSPTQSDSIADTKIEDISNNNTTDSGLQSQMDDFQLTRSPDAPIIASSVKSSLGSTPDINVESMATDEISSLISEKAENSPTQSDSIADTKIEDISNNNTTDSGLQSQMDDFQLTRSPDAPIIASSVKSSLGSTPDINVESMATDEISSLISEKAENSPTQSDSIADIKVEDTSNNNTTDSGLQSQMDDIQLTRSPDAPIIASSVKSSLGSTPDINVESMATDEISSLISEKAENSPTQSDSIADTKIEDISNNNTTDSGLQSQMDDIQLTRSPDAPIIASSVKSSLGSTPDVNVESTSAVETSGLIPCSLEDVSSVSGRLDAGGPNSGFGSRFSNVNSVLGSTVLSKKSSVASRSPTRSIRGTSSTSNLSMSSGLRASNSSLASKSFSKLPQSQMNASSLAGTRSSFKGSMDVLRVEPHSISPTQKFSSSPSSPNLSHRLAPNQRTLTTSSKLPIKSGLSSAHSNSSISTKSKLTTAASINANTSSPNIS